MSGAVDQAPRRTREVEAAARLARDAEILRRQRAGAAKEALAREFGLSRGMISHVIGLALQREAAAARRCPPTRTVEIHLTDKDFARLIAVARAAGATPAGLAAALVIEGLRRPA